MAQERVHLELGEVMDLCLKAAENEWCVEHRGSRSNEDALAMDVSTRWVSGEISHRYGTLKVLVTLTCRRPWLSETYFKKFQRGPMGLWRGVTKYKM